MAQPSHRKSWSPEQLERYLAGQMPDADRHELERAMLDDPFLADAVDGMRSRSHRERTQDLDILGKRLASRTDEKVVPLRRTRWWWAAAAALILIGSGMYWWSDQVGREKQLSQLAKTDTVSTPAITTPPPTQDSTRIAVPAETNQAKPGAVTSAPQAKLKQDIQNLISADKVEKHEEKSFPKNESEQLAKVNNPLQPSPAAPVPSNRAASGILSEVEAGMHMYRGRVVDEKGRGMAFANIRISNGGVPTYTDAKGEFRFMSQDTTLDIISHAAGYADGTASMKLASPSAIILMIPEMNGKRDEVKIKQAKTKSASKAQVSQHLADSLAEGEQDMDEPQEAVPVDGWSKYEQYLNNNRRVFAMGNDDTDPVVEISFMVSSGGTPYDLKVEHSSSEAYEREALRLLREGPKWGFPKNAKKSVRSYITVHF